MHEEVIDVVTPAGAMNTYVFRPEEDAPHPLIIFLMDSAGVREGLADMCRRLASAGFCVAMPNLYYRQARFLDVNVDRLADPAYGETTGLMWRLNRSLTQDGVMDDLRHLLDRFDGDPALRSERIGTIGFCVSGRFAFRASAHFPERVRASACVYGVDYITAAPDSPHLLAERLKGEVYVAMAEHDQYVPAGVETQLAQIFRDARVQGRVEVFPGTEHGFALPGRRAYHKAAAERLWERLHSLFRRNLQAPLMDAHRYAVRSFPCSPSGGGQTKETIE